MKDHGWMLLVQTSNCLYNRASCLYKSVRCESFIKKFYGNSRLHMSPAILYLVTTTSSAIVGSSSELSPFSAMIDSYLETLVRSVSITSQRRSWKSLRF